MRGADVIDPALPNELLDDLLRRVGVGAACMRDLDACVLVCRRWRHARIAASGARADEVLRLVAERLPALADVSVDERLAVASAYGASGSRSRRPTRQGRCGGSGTLTISMSSSVSGAPEEIERSWSSCVIYCVSRLSKAGKLKEDGVISLCQILRLSKLSFKEFFKDIVQPRIIQWKLWSVMKKNILRIMFFQIADMVMVLYTGWRRKWHSKRLHQ